MDLTAIIMAVINPAFAFATVIFGGFMTFLMARINNKVDEAKKVNDATHALVNSNMGAQLKISWRLAEKVAKLSKKKEDIDDAAETKRLYDEHMKKQALVDLMQHE